MSATQPNKANLLVVSNRLPLSIKRKPDGSYSSTDAAGGLVTALSGLAETTNFLWFGWPGVEVTGESEQQEVKRMLGTRNAVPIFLDEKLANAHYNGFSNAILWPILHYQPVALFDDDAWDGYRTVNELFADAVADVAKDGDLIWVHDYHLMLLPQLLRDRLRKKGKTARIGFSLHTQFPAADVYRALPIGKDLLCGMLSCDLIGFHTDDYKDSFANACRALVGLSPPQGNILQYEDRQVELGRFVVGIDPQKFYDALNDPQVKDRIRELDEHYKGIKRIVGVDRLDFIKGLPQKLRGFEAFLDQHPDWVGKVVLMQVAVPSREDVKEYQQLCSEVSEIVGRINGKFGTAKYTPLIYIHRSVPFEELTALYAVSDACLLASTRDGMNLVAFEYVACQAERQGSLLISEFAGAAAYMEPGGITFNPANPKDIARAIQQGLTVSPEERRAHYTKLKEFVEQYTSRRWGESFVEKLRSVPAAS